MRTSFVPAMHCEKMAVTDMSFRQRAVVEFLVKEGNSAGLIYQRLRGVYGGARDQTTKRGMTSHHIAQKRNRKQYPRPAKLQELSFGTVVDAYWSTLWKMGKR
jgi:hypothetical protein